MSKIKLNAVFILALGASAAGCSSTPVLNDYGRGQAVERYGRDATLVIPSSHERTMEKRRQAAGATNSGRAKLPFEDRTRKAIDDEIHESSGRATNDRATNNLIEKALRRGVGEFIRGL